MQTTFLQVGFPNFPISKFFGYKELKLKIKKKFPLSWLNNEASLSAINFVFTKTIHTRLYIWAVRNFCEEDSSADIMLLLLSFQIFKMFFLISALINYC